MSNPLITCTQDDFQRMADRIVEKVRTSDRFSKSMVLKIMAETACGPRSDWGAVRNAKTDHIVSQRAQARSASPAAAAPREYVSPIKLQTSNLALPELLAGLFSAGLGNAILPTVPGVGAFYIAETVARAQGKTVREVRLATLGAEDFARGSEHLAKILGLSPNDAPDVLTVYTEAGALRPQHLAAVLETIMSAPGRAQALVIDYSGGKAIKDLPGIGAGYLLNHWITLPLHGVPAGDLIQASAPAKGPEVSMEPSESLIASVDVSRFAPKPDGRTVKITGQQVGDEICISLRDEEGWGISGLQMYLSRAEVKTIEDFLADPSKPVDIRNHIRFRSQNGRIDIEGLGAAHQDYITDVHIDDIRLALAPFMKFNIQTSALMQAQRERLARASA